VFSIFQDSRGFIWIGTNKGLFRHDGYSFKRPFSENNNLELADMEVKAIAEDNQHRLWIGCYGYGLLCYDLENEKFIPITFNINFSNKINKIIIDAQQFIWVATDKGLVKIYPLSDSNKDYNLNAEIHYPLKQSINIVHENIIDELYEDSFDNGRYLWLGTDGGLIRFDKNTNQFLFLNTRPQNAIRQIVNYNAEKLLVGSWDGGVFLINRNTCTKTSDEWIDKVNNFIGNTRVNSMIMDNDHKIWIGTINSGLYILSRKPDGSINIQNYKKGTQLPQSFYSDFVNTFYLDKQQVMWIGTTSAGLVKMTSKSNEIETIRIKSNNDVDIVTNYQSLYLSIDKNNVWVGTSGNGLLLYNPDNKKSLHFTADPDSKIKLPSNYIPFCMQDKKGNLWFVEQGKGIYFIPSNKIKDISPDNPLVNQIIPIEINPLISTEIYHDQYIMQVYNDNEGRIWIGTWTALHCITFTGDVSNARNISDIEKNSSVKTFFSPKQSLIKNFYFSPVFAIVEDAFKNMWIGTRNDGLLKLTFAADGKFNTTFYSASHGLNSKQVFDLYVDRDKRLWVATNSGLYLFNYGKNEFRRFSESMGLANDNVIGIIQDKNSNIWISSSDGISLISLKKNSIKSYYFIENYGLNQYNVNARVAFSNGQIMFGSNDGLIRFHPDSVFKSTYIPPIYFTDIRINNTSVYKGQKLNGTVITSQNSCITNKITVPYNNIITLEFAALDYTYPQRNHYRYMHEGADHEWVVLNSNQRNITLSNLSKGTYKIIISGSNAEGVWNPTDKIISIKVLPPWWQSNPAIVIYFIILIGIMLLYRQFMFKIAEEKSELERERFERKKVEEMNIIRNHFFTNVSHECRTPLTLIINPLEKLSTSTKLDTPELDQIKLSYKNSKRLLRLIDELMDFSKLENNTLRLAIQEVNLVSFTKNVCNYFNDQILQQKINFQIISNNENINAWIDTNKFEKVIFNLLSNAFKYTPANGSISVEIDNSNIHELNISISNTGPGIEESEIDKIFQRYYQVNFSINKQIAGTGIGLSMVKSYVELHHGIIDVTSEPGKITCFKITIPSGNRHFSKDDILTSITALQEQKNLYEDATGQQIENKSNHEQTSGTILIVEDNIEIRNYLKQELSHLFNIFEAIDGQDGIDKAIELNPDLIISDLIMPICSGIELCKKLKNDITTSHIPIILLTAKAEIESQIEGLEVGADVYLTKPFNVRFLEAQILRLIESRENVYKKFAKENHFLPGEIAKSTIDQEFLNKVLEFIEKNIAEPELNVEQLSSNVALSRIQVYRKIKAISGQSPVEFIRTIRLKKAATLIMENKLNYSEIAFETGFATASYFTRCFKEHFGKTPTEYANEFRSKPIN
jgi:signal transduction histidine kinase/ligand-binding sensor domain-containing protein/DNA-binding response OmpR family regulator